MVVPRKMIADDSAMAPASVTVSTAKKGAALHFNQILSAKHGAVQTDNPKTPVAAPNRHRLNLNRNRTRAFVVKTLTLSEKP